MNGTGSAMNGTGSPTEHHVQGRFTSNPCVMGCSAWCKKYFWEGQLLNKTHAPADDSRDGKYWLHRFLLGHRRIFAMATPVCFFHFAWWSIAITNSIWHLFQERYFMTITMILGGIIGGMTSEGGGAVAFPVMTLAFNIEPTVARDFSLMIQSCGMTASAFTIIFMKVKIDWYSLIFCSLGGVVGTIFGLEIVDPLLDSDMKKMLYVSIWWASSFTLFFLNIFQPRKTCQKLESVNVAKLAMMVGTGFLGGIFTSFAGSGINICCFSILTLFFRLSEKVATPTSVVLMAANSLLGFFWRGLIMNTITDEAWEFMTVCVPVVVISAPLGSFIGSHFHRHVLAGLVCLIDSAALIGAFVLVPQTSLLSGVSVGIILGGIVFFFTMNKLGGWILLRDEINSYRLSRGTSVSLSDIPTVISLVGSSLFASSIGSGLNHRIGSGLNQEVSGVSYNHTSGANMYELKPNNPPIQANNHTESNHIGNNEDSEEPYENYRL